MTDFTDEYLNKVKEKIDAYNQLDKLIKKGLVDRAELDKFDGTIIPMPLIQMYRAGYLIDSAYLFVTKFNGEYLVYNIIKDARLIIKGYITVESYEYESPEFTEARNALMERERKKAEEARRAHASQVSLYGGFQVPSMSMSYTSQIIEDKFRKIARERNKSKFRRLFKWPY